MIEYLCHKCSAPHKEAPAKRGQKIACPKCGVVCVVEPAIKHNCTHCNALLVSPWELGGQTDTCPICHTPCSVPETKEHIRRRELQEENRRKKQERDAAHSMLAKQEAKDLEKAEALYAICDREQAIAHSSTAIAAYESLRKLHTHLQVGLALEQYMAQLGEALHAYGTFCEHPNGNFPMFTGYLKMAFAEHAEALQLWRKIEAIGGGGAGIIGGGFGLEGALVGIGIATALNSVAATAKRAAVEPLAAKRSDCWRKALSVLGSAAAIIRNARDKALPELPSRGQADTCANCGRSIGTLETPHLWREQVVCAGCHKLLTME